MKVKIMKQKHAKFVLSSYNFVILQLSNISLKEVISTQDQPLIFR